MATITSAQTGNFSSTSTWVGGVVPTSADDAVAANGHVVTIDTDVTVLSFQQAGTGKFVLPGGRTVTGNVIANAGTFTSGGTVEVTASTGQTATINGNVTGVSSTAVNIAGIVMTGVGTLVLNGSVTGSAGNASASSNGHAGVYTNVSCSITINGSLVSGTGTWKFALWAGDSSGSCAVTINGVINTSTNTQTYGVFMGGASNVLTVNTTTISGSLLILSSGASGVTNLYCNVIGGGGTNGRSVVVNGTSSVVNIFGSIFSQGGANSIAVEVSGTSSVLNVVGNITVQNGSGTAAVTFNNIAFVTGVITAGFVTALLSSVGGAQATITGNIIGGTGTNGFGVSLSGGAAVATVTGAVTGGAGGSAHGINMTGASSVVNIIGPVAGASTLSHGIRSDATANGVIFQGNLTDSLQGATAIYARLLRITATNTGTTTYTNTVGYPNGTPVTRVSPNLITGMPATNNVRSGTVYGFNSELTGTMVVPSNQSVSYGVPVDNTVGTASLRPEDFASLVGAQIAAAVRDLN